MTETTVKPGQIWWSGAGDTHLRVERPWLPSDAEPGDEPGPAWWVETCDAYGNVNGKDRYVAEPSYFEPNGIYVKVRDSEEASHE